jgi:hypothetical protein
MDLKAKAKRNKLSLNARFQVLAVASTKTAFWDPDDGGSTHTE